MPKISIHSPHAGRDTNDCLVGNLKYISIHSPHAGRDVWILECPLQMSYFNPLSPCGERLLVFITIRMRSLFQSTLPMRGETPIQLEEWLEPGKFQSTLPMRGETVLAGAVDFGSNISIHSPHAGRDRAVRVFQFGHDISIHSPHAGRDYGREALLNDIRISIHSPHAGRDRHL